MSATEITQYEVTEGRTTLSIRLRDRTGRDIWAVTDTRGEGAAFEGLEAALEQARVWVRPLEQARVLRETADEIDQRVHREMENTPFPTRVRP